MVANPKTLYLHIGAEKTGTTSIQVALTTYSEALRQSSGVYYPVCTPLFFNTAHFPLVGAFLDPSELDFVPPSRRLSIADVRQSLRALNIENDGHTLILSAEHLSSRLPFSKLTILKEVMRETLPDYSIKIIYHVRSQPSLYCSYYSSFVQSFKTGWPKPQSIKSEDRYYDSLNIACEWAHEFGFDNMRVLNFHGGNSISLFSDAVAIAFPGDARAKDFLENPSLSYEECRLLEIINGWFEPFDCTSYDGFDKRQRLRDLFLGHVRTMPISRTLHRQY